MVFDRFPFRNAPIWPFAFVVYTASQKGNPQKFNNCVDRAYNYMDCMPCWKGDILVLKFNTFDNILTNVSVMDKPLCYALLQVALVHGHLREYHNLLELHTTHKSNR